MTRFARAKGSKASNEKKPEEATSWTEMKKALLSKKKEEFENQSPKRIAKIDSGQKHSEWAPLGGDNHSELLLRQHVVKKNKEGNKIEMMEKNKKVKKKKKILNKTEEKASVSMSGKSKKNIMNRQTSFSDGSEGKVKKNKKRQGKTIDDSEGTSPRKKKKMEEAATEPVVQKNKQTNKTNKVEAEVGNTKKTQEKKTGAKFKPNKIKRKIKGNYNENGKKPIQGKFSEQRKGKNKFQNKSSEKACSAIEELIINGEKIEIVKFQGFPVTLEDAERLKKLRSEMKKEGIPRDKLEAAIKLERRRAEKALSRLKKNVCFHCRGHGHLLSNCPDLMEKESTGTGICYKCGSTEHSAVECKVVRGSNYQFAECFICKEQGHIARQCPDNPRGLYPQGGACRECGDVTHLRKDCPNVLSKKEEEAVTVALRNDRNLECLDEEIVNKEKRKNSARTAKKNSTVKF